jgi:hypothetical protein
MDITAVSGAAGTELAAHPLFELYCHTARVSKPPLTYRLSVMFALPGREHHARIVREP